MQKKNSRGLPGRLRARILEGKNRPIPEVDRSHVFVFLQTPRRRKVFQTKLLTLIDEQGSPLGDYQQRKEFSGIRSPFSGIVPEARHNSRLIVVLDKDTVKTCSSISIR